MLLDRNFDGSSWSNVLISNKYNSGNPQKLLLLNEITNQKKNYIYTNIDDG